MEKSSRNNTIPKPLSQDSKIAECFAKKNVITVYIISLLFTYKNLVVKPVKPNHFDIECIAYFQKYPKSRNQNEYLRYRKKACS